MATTKLAVYNRALVLLGERKLASLTESREPRRVLDDLWSFTTEYCLEQGQWNFAMRAVEIEASASVTPDFGYSNAHDKPTDWVRTCAISADDTFSVPLGSYSEEGDYWYSDVDPLYVKYVSNDDAYGLDLGKWPRTFENFVAHQLAATASERLTQSSSKTDALLKLARIAKADAAGKDAIGEAAQFPPPGRWISAALGGRRFGGRRYLRG